MIKLLNLCWTQECLDTFILPENMIDEEIIDKFKEKNLKKSFGYVQGLSNLGSEKFIKT